MQYPEFNEILSLFQADGSDTVNEADLADSSGGSVIGSDLAYSGLRPEDIQETKDRLLVETADMLDVCLLSAQALLRDNSRYYYYYYSLLI